MLDRRRFCPCSSIALRSAVALSSLVGFAVDAYAGDLANSPVILRNGDWSVHRTHDPMTDAKVCTGVYKDNYDIQLSATALLISIPDGLKSVRLRFDNEDAEELRLPRNSERAISAININGADYQRLLRSKRLRFEALTLTDNVVNGDLDLNGVNIIRSNIEAGCFGNPINAPAAAATAPPSAPECSDGARARMAQKGISAQDIVFFCTAP